MHALAAVSWDPQLRGALILLIGVLVLPGSVLLLLWTNVGARVGILLAAAGLSGLLLLLNIIWLMAPLGTGPIGYKGSSSGSGYTVVVADSIELTGGSSTQVSCDYDSLSDSLSPIKTTALFK